MKIKFFFSVYFLFPILIYSQIIFEADFDSGNLQSVTTSDSINYSLRIRSDIVGRWFYFKMKNVRNRYVSVTIQNSDVTRPMYSYDNKNWIRFTEIESPQKNLFKKTYTEDLVYVAYYVPYSVERLHQKISQLNLNPYVKIDTIGFSEQNRPLIVLTITDFTVTDSQKFFIWSHGRTHPSETPSSYHLDGMINFLLSDDDIAEYLRQKIKFIVLPFINPDGVYLGKSRVNANNIDLERSWNLSDTETPKEVKFTKAYLQNILNNNRFHIALNMHSQVANYSTFWIHTASSTSEYFYRREMQFANLQAANSEFIRQSDFSYSNLQPYFPEGWMWANWGDQIMALTYETPYTKFSNNVWIDNEILFQFGKETIYGIMEYLNINHPKRFIIDNRDAIASGNWNLSNSNSFWNFYGNDFLYILPNELNNYIEWASPQLEYGKYLVYTMYQDLATSATNVQYEIYTSNYFSRKFLNQQINGGLWNFLDSVNLNSNDQIKVRLLSRGDGTITGDAIRIFYAGSVSEVTSQKSIEPYFFLYQNYPNPFNSSTKIRFSIKSSDRSLNKVTLKIYNILGEELTTLIDDFYSAGTYEVDFLASKTDFSLICGVYFAKLIVNNQSKTIKMVYLK